MRYCGFALTMLAAACVGGCGSEAASGTKPRPQVVGDAPPPPTEAERQAAVQAKFAELKALKTADRPKQK